MKIICLDDHSIMLDSLVRELNILASGADISAFQDAQTTIEFAQENGCDIFFCEINLRGTDGVMVAEKMQQINPRVNVIFTTVCEEAERAKEVFRLHPSGYITKPYTQEQLARELRNLRYKVEERYSGYDRRESMMQQDNFRGGYAREYGMGCGEFSAFPGYKPSGYNMASEPCSPRAEWAAAPAAPAAKREEPKAEAPKVEAPKDAENSTIASSKDIRRLSRTELLEMLIAQTKEYDAMAEKLREAEEKLERKTLDMKKAGSIAEASLQINGVFEAAQRAADQYLENIRVCEAENAQRERASRERAEFMVAEAKVKCSRIESETAERCEEMIRKAEMETEKRWNELHERMDSYIREHDQLRSLISMFKV